MSKRDNTIDHTRKFWQQRDSSEVTNEDARQIIENVTGFFSLLKEWEMAERNNTRSSTDLKS